MISFTCCFLALVVGYFVYGKFIEKIAGVDLKRVTPAFTKQDGVDFLPLPTWKIFMIQFLNIAGLGPIFGAILGAKFGSASFLWIVLGSIFAGATHDFLAGFLSLRKEGASLPEIVGMYLGDRFKQFMRAFTIVLMILVGGSSVLYHLSPFGMDWYLGAPSSLVIMGCIGCVLLFGVPLFYIGSAIATSLFHTKPLPDTGKWTLVILWVISFILLGIYFYQTGINGWNSLDWSNTSYYIL